MISWKHGLLSLLVLSSVVSCIKEPLEETETPATVAEVQDSLATAWGQADPLTMAKNDFLFQETEQTLENNPQPFYVLQEAVTIYNKEEKDDEWLYTYIYATKAFKGNEEGPQSSRETTRSVAKLDASIANAQRVMSYQPELKTMADDNQMVLGFERLYGLAYACEKSDALDKYCKEDLQVDSCDITCSNLKVEEEMRPVPDLIKAQPNCGGFENCTIKTKKVSFNWTIALKRGETVEKQKVNYWVTLSPDMPFFSRMQEYCYRQLYPIQSQKVLVTTCTKLKNFKRGTP
ncbi:hypothetical protein ACLWBD_02610 [Bdellovibrio sp. HCB117]|uniref:hypothetical protein n=1 Tax=Bdellovibrio sp. HCB117 TaxID=3394359 RepID=UPI0039B39CBC